MLKSTSAPMLRDPRMWGPHKRVRKGLVLVGSEPPKKSNGGALLLHDIHIPVPTDEHPLQLAVDEMRSLLAEQKDTQALGKPCGSTDAQVDRQTDRCMHFKQGTCNFPHHTSTPNHAINEHRGRSAAVGPP